MKILVIQQKMIGDVLASSIICNNLRLAYPDAQIDYLIYELTVPILEGNPNIDNVLLFQEKHRKSKREFLNLALEIRSFKYDILIDAYSKLESWIIVLLSGAKRKISYKKAGRTFLYTDNVPFSESPKTNMGLAIERRLSLLKPLSLPTEIDAFPKLFVTEKENQNALTLFEKHQVRKDRKTVMISIIGSEKIKTYPLKYMSKIIDTIADLHDVNLLFNYFQKQIEEAKIVYDNCKPSTQEKIYFDLLGDDLRSFIAITNNCDMIIGNDGGAINIAKALGKPSFIIFSPWIEKKIWATFEDGIKHVSTHLSDFIPELFTNYSEKKLKNKTPELYKKFEPALFKDLLKTFLNANFSMTEAVLTLKIIPIKIPLSALIITYNEEKNIKKIILDLDFTDEIILVDSFSTDNTVALVKTFENLTLIQHKFENFTSQRNFAITQAKNDWILFLDADERLTPDLKNEIINTLRTNDTYTAFLFRRTFMFKDKVLHYSGWQTDKIYRLFNKNFAKYTTERLIHEKLKVTGKIGILKNKLIHYSYSDYESYKAKMINYGKLKAQEKFIKKLKPIFLASIIHPTYNFLYNYFIRLGILDGRKGVVICYLNAYSVYIRYQELKKLWNSK
jgi:ADP-heptose:LPS heptosyltransferase